MIYEHAIVSIRDGAEDDFEAAFRRAPALFARVPGCHGAQLRRCIESPRKYELLIGWDDVDAHMVGFRGSPLFGEWRALVGDYFTEPPAVQHYTVVEL